MEEKKSPESDGSDALETLEDKDTAVTAKPEDEKLSDIEKGKKAKKKPGSGNILSRFASRVNIYLLLFILLIVVALIIMFVVINASKKEVAKQENITAQELTQEAVENLSSNEATVGDPKQLLNIESNAVFSGKVQSAMG
jgi:cell division protein FtsL